MEKSIKHSFKGLNQDTTKSKFSNEFYFDAKNIRLNTTDAQTIGSLSNEKGNLALFTIPTPVINYGGKSITYGASILTYTTDEINYGNQSGNQQIIAQCPTRDSIIFISTDNNGFDCVWQFKLEDYSIKLLYLRNLNLSINNPPQIINNFENEKVDKIYWVDSINQLRFLNLKHSKDNSDLEELIDIPVGVIDMVGKYSLSQPLIIDLLSGGTHTSGMIQYGYNLYRLNSLQTKISPLSELVSLDKGNAGGGLVNEVVSVIPNIKITDIDHNYSHIKVYAIKYTSLNEIPSISLIEDKELPTTGDVQVFDDGKVIKTLSLEEFVFLGSDIIIPKHINTKFNRMFFANYKEINFNVDIDTRAYSYNSSNVAKVYKDLTTIEVLETKPYYPYDTVLVPKPSGTFFNIVNDADYDDVELVKHDSINLDYNTYKFQKNGSTLGGEGKYLKYELTKSTVFNENNRYFKDDEIYRIGIEFFNAYGQVSLPNWIADFRAPDGNLNGQYNTLSVTLKSEFYTWLNNSSNFIGPYAKPTGYKIIVAERTLNDRTIVANGLLCPMMVNDKTTRDFNYPHSLSDITYLNTQVDSLVKLPNILSRNYNKTNIYGISRPLVGSKHLDSMSRYANTPDNETPRSSTRSGKAGKCFQYNAMLQLYSPEILFNDSISLSEGLQIKIKGSLKNNINNSWGRIYEASPTAPINDEIRVTKGLIPQYLQSGGSVENIVNGATSPWARGLITGVFTNDYSKVGIMMYDRIYGGNIPSDINTGKYQKAPTSINYDIYGKPELVEKGQSAKNYNNDPKYRYGNSLESVLLDSGRDNYDDANHSVFGGRIVSINSYGNKCVVLVPGNNSSSHYNRPCHESMGLFSNITGNDNGLIGELVKTDNEIYLGNIYGGNSYEDKKRTNYIEIGEYKKLNTNDTTSTIIIDSPGDTFVNFFKFARIVRTDKDIISEGYYTLEELVTVLSETTVDLKNRSDISFNDWKTKFQPLDDEYHKYNKVYSQQPKLIQKRDLNYNIKKINNFDTNIISTKLKSAGELIDNWTDLSTNDVITLDGKFGAITALPSFNDEIYALQEQSLAFISVNPRVQVQGGDGLSIELGSGNVLDRYKYISTTSGTLNKWSVINTPSGLYYYDLLNKGLMLFTNQLVKLSDTKGLHSFFLNNTDDNSLKIDNHLLGTGITTGYDYLNNDLFITFKQNNKLDFTLSFNEYLNEFVSFYDFIPSLYVSKGSNFLTTTSDNRNVYKQNAGNYNTFYGATYPSHVTLNVNPEADKDCIFNNLEYKSEVTINSVDQPISTLTDVQLWNEYQTSNLTPLTLNSNLSRKFRNWRITLPRKAGSRDRIRNPWVFLKLQFQNNTNKKLILHDTLVHYSV